MGDLPGPGSGRARPPFAGAPNCCYTPIQRQTLTTEEYTLSLPLSCLKTGTTSLLDWLPLYLFQRQYHLGDATTGGTK